jgi:hypothetical protein
MSYTLWESIAETPWWFYLILIALFRIAYLTTKPRFFFIKPLLLSQALYIIFITLTFFLMTKLSLLNMPIFFSLLGLGSVLGWIQFRFKQIKVIKDKSQIYIPGTWLFFISLFILIPAKYYYFGSQITIDMNVFQQAQWIPFIYGFSGFVIGLTLGRTFYLLQVVNK